MITFEQADYINDLLAEMRKEIDIIEGPEGPQGPKGYDGIKGEQGERGADGRGIVKIEVDKDGNLMVEYTDGSVVNAGKVKDTVQNAGIVAGGGNAGPPVKYTHVADAEYTVIARSLIVGHNIFGVDAGQDATVYLPPNIDPTKIVVVSNESDTYNVTTQEL